MLARSLGVAALVRSGAASLWTPRSTAVIVSCLIGRRFLSSAAPDGTQKGTKARGRPRAAASTASPSRLASLVADRSVSEDNEGDEGDVSPSSSSSSATLSSDEGESDDQPVPKLKAEKELPPGTATPAMRQYMAIKKSYPYHILMFRLGDFYEMFFDDAVRCANFFFAFFLHLFIQISPRIVQCRGRPWHCPDQARLYLGRRAHGRRSGARSRVLS